MDIAVKNTINQAIRNVRHLHRHYIKKALVTSLNKVGKEVMTVAKRELADATGLKVGRVFKTLKKGVNKATKHDETFSFWVKGRRLNLVEFDARQTKKGITAKAWGKRKLYPKTFFGSGRNSGKKLVFKRAKGSRGVEAVHGASLPREFERQDMKKIFNKKIKIRFPILFREAINFHMLKSLRKI